MMTLKQFADVCRKFDHIKFNDATHTYYVSKTVRYSGITSFLKSVKQPFDKEKWATIKAKQKGVSKASIINEWDNSGAIAIDKGKKVHYYLEMLWNNKIVDCPCQGARMFYADYMDNMTLLKSEFVICDDDMMLASQLDGLFMDTKGGIIIGDYKTNKDFTKESKYRLLHPCEDLFACHLDEYSLQVSFYKYMLQKAGMEVNDMWIIWIRDDGYKVIKAKDLTRHVELICKHHLSING